MCQELAALRQSIGAYAAGFDARRLSVADAAVAVGLCSAIEASAAAMKALAAARVGEGADGSRGGYRSAAEQLADRAGMSPGAARRTLETGRRMADQPEVAQAALAGELSPEQATAVSDAVAVAPDKAAELIDRARHSSLPELNEEVARVKALATNPEERRTARHARRSLRKWTDRDGALQAHLYGHPEDGARLWRMIDPVMRRLNLLRQRAGGERDGLDALEYDALMTVVAAAIGRDDAELGMADLLSLGLFPQMKARSNTAADAPPDIGKPRTKKLAGSPLRLMIRVDLESLLRGVPIEGELCEIPGYGPVPVSVVEDLVATENPFIIGVITRGQAVCGVYHHGRHPNAAQRSALDFLYPTCAVAGCSARAGLQYDHRVDFASSRITAFDLLDRLCPFHHAQKTRYDWALVAGRGKRAFVAPDDPRHPRRAGSPPGRPARAGRGEAPPGGAGRSGQVQARPGGVGRPDQARAPAGAGGP